MATDHADVVRREFARQAETFVGEDSFFANVPLQRGDVTDRWLTQARTPDDVAGQIRAELRAELDGGAPTGLRATMDNGELAFLHEWHLVVAQRI